MIHSDSTWSNIYAMAADPNTTDADVRASIMDIGEAMEYQLDAESDYIELSRAVARHLLAERTKRHGC